MSENETKEEQDLWEACRDKVQQDKYLVNLIAIPISANNRSVTKQKRKVIKRKMPETRNQHCTPPPETRPPKRCLIATPDKREQENICLIG